MSDLYLLNQVDYKKKLKPDEIKWLEAFNADFKKSYSKGDAYTASEPVRTIGNGRVNSYDMPEFEVAYDLTAEMILTIAETKSLPEPKKKIWIRSQTKTELHKGICFLKPKGKFDHPLHDIYRRMLDYCYNPKGIGYERYGARGIRVCARWFYSFESFVEDIQSIPKFFTLVLIDKNKDFGPSNVKFKKVTARVKKSTIDNLDIESINHDFYVLRMPIGKIVKKHGIPAAYVKQAIKLRRMTKCAL